MASHTSSLLRGVRPTQSLPLYDIGSYKWSHGELALDRAHSKHLSAKTENHNAAFPSGTSLVKPVTGHLFVSKEGSGFSWHVRAPLGSIVETKAGRGLQQVSIASWTTKRLEQLAKIRGAGRVGTGSEFRVQNHALAQVAVPVAENAGAQLAANDASERSEGADMDGEQRHEKRGHDLAESSSSLEGWVSHGPSSRAQDEEQGQDRMESVDGEGQRSRIQDAEGPVKPSAHRGDATVKHQIVVERWRSRPTREVTRRRSRGPSDAAEFRMQQGGHVSRVINGAEASNSSEDFEEERRRRDGSGSDDQQAEPTAGRAREPAVDQGWKRRDGGQHSESSGSGRAQRLASGNAGEDGREGAGARKVLGRAITHLRELQPGTDIGEVMEQRYSRLSRSQLVTVISKQQEWRTAMAVVEWMESCGKVEGDMAVYAALVRVLGDAWKWTVIDSLLTRLEAREQPPDERVYESLMHAYSRAKLPEKVVDAFDRMADMGIQPGTKAYNLAMVALQKAPEPRRLIPQAERILVQMNTQNIRYVVPYNCMLNLYVKVGQHKKALRLLRDMEELGLEMDIYTFNAALSAFSQAGNVDAAADLFKWLVSHKTYAPMVYTYTIMVGVYGQAGRLEAAVELLDDMRTRGLRPDVVLYNNLLSYLASAGLVNDVAEVYQQLKAAGPAPDSQTYALVVAAYGRVQRLPAVAQVIEDMVAAECPPSEMVWDAVAKACGRCVLQEAAVDSLLARIRTLGWLPTAAQARWLMTEYRKERPLPQEVLRACQEVHEAGERLDEFTWRSLVGFHFYRGQLEEVLRALEGMSADGHKAKQGTLCMLLDLHGTKGNVAQAQKLFREMKRDLGHLDLVSCNTMMNAYAQAGMPEEALELLGSMQAEGVAPDTRTWTLVLKAHGNAGQAGGALEAYWAMLEADCPMDEIAYNTVINVCGRELALEDTLQVYRRMLEEGYRPNSMTCNLVLSLLAKSNRLSEAEDMFKKLKRSGRADSVTFCTMADAYGKRRHLDRMEEVGAEARESGVPLEASLYNAMIDAYGKAGMHTHMESTLRHMQAAGVRPNQVTFNSLIHAYSIGNMAVEMEEVLQRQKAAGVERDTWTYNILIGAYGELEMPYASVKVVRDMQDAGLAPDEVTYRNLTKAFRRAGDYLEAARWSLWMKQAGFKGLPETDSAQTWTSFTTLQNDS